MADNSKPAVHKTKRKGQWKPGQSGNPKGAPKRGQSWAEVIREIGEMTPDEARAMSDKIFAQIRLGNEITLKQAVVMRVFAGLLFEPSPGNFRELMDRAEGRVRENVELTGDETRPIRIVLEYADDHAAPLASGTADDQAAGEPL